MTKQFIMAQSITPNQCCPKHFMSMDHVKEFTDMVDDHDHNEANKNSQNRYTLYREPVKMLLRRGHSQYAKKHPYPAIIMNKIRNRHPKKE